MKLKNHKATVKRVKRTAGGKIVRVKAAKSHLLTHKSDPTKTLLAVAGVDLKRVKKLAPYL